MKFSVALIAYVLTVLICIVFPIVIGVLTSKRRIFKPAVAHVLLGALFFVVAIIGLYLLLRYHLTTQDGVSNYYNTATYRITVVGLVSVAFSIILWIFGMLVYARRQAYNQGISFYIGFGCGGCVLVGLYSLMMLLVLIYQYFTSTLLRFDTTVQAFYFSPDTYVPVFSPVFGHVSLGIAVLSLLILSVLFSVMMNCITAKKVPLSISVLAFIGLTIALAVLITLVLFMSMLELPHYLLAVLAIACDALGACMVLLVDRRADKAQGEYAKQFE